MVTTEKANDRAVEPTATLEDVARAAGVSRMTVSRVLNGRGGASAETQRRVLMAAESLDYRPNAFARSLKSRRSNTIGFIVPDICNPFFPEVFRGAESVALKSGYHLVLSNVVESTDRELEVIDNLAARQVDGLIWCSARSSDGEVEAALRRVPAAVLVNRRVSGGLAGSVSVDYATGARLAGTHLVAKGRRAIGLIAGPHWSVGAQQRNGGIRSAVAASDARIVCELSCTPDIAGGQMAASTLLARGTKVDAFVCYNDLNAIGAQMACRNLGLDVPKDIAIVGFDDIEMAALVTPAITSLGVDLYGLGRSAMDMLTRRIDGDSTQDDILLQPRLVMRDSTG